MLKRELNVNFKSLIIWISIIVCIFVFVFLLYPHIINPVDKKAMQDMLSVFPADVLKAFNMDISDISTAYGWFKTEGLVFLTLIFGSFAALQGSSILLKEESDKTIDFLYSKPISRNYILKNKIISGIINICIVVIISTIFLILGLYMSDCLNLSATLLLCLTQIVSMIVFFLLNLYISTYFKKTKQTIGIALATVFISYFLSMFSTVSDKLSFLKYFSINTLNDTRGIIESSKYNMVYLFIGLVLSVIFVILIYKRYNKKEFC